MNMRGYVVNGNCGLIKKSISFIIASVVSIALSLPVSFAKDSISPVTSPMPEPVPSIVSGSDYDTVTLYYVVQWNASFAGSNTKYILYEMICKIPHGASAVFNIKRQQTALFFSGDRLPPFTRNIYDVLTGSLLESNTNANFVSYGSVSGYSSSYGFTSGYFPENNASSDICAGGFAIVPDAISIVGGESVYNSAPFVTWSQQLPEHNVFHSQLSEPVCDKYNRYFVIDDRLYWLSIQLNGFFIEKSVFENTTVVVPDYEFAGDETIHDDQNGTYSHVWMEFNGKQYIPVSLISGNFSNDLPFYLTLIPGDSEIRVVLEPYSFINGTNSSGLPYYLQSSFFLSEFNLEDGSYITSSFTEVNSSISLSHYLNLSVEPGSSVHCYGINWYNNLNLPYNLSDVLWEYDLEFVQWRDSMLSTLNQIRSLLSGDDQTVPEPGSYPDYAGSLQESDSGYSNIQAADIKLELNNALGDGKYDHAAGQVKEWIDLFSIPKIIGVCILALALGTVTLTLGKKKSD